MAKIAVALSVVTGLATVTVVYEDRSLAPDVPLLASSVVAWGGGFLLAFSASMRALLRDREEGIVDLVARRDGSHRSYVLARTLGLAALVAAVVAGTTLASGVAAMALADRAASIARTFQATLASVVFALAFAGVVAPIALATLGPRPRIAGYGALLTALVLPQLFVVAARRAWPEEVCELLAPTSALAAVKASLAPGTFDVLRFARALVASSVFASVAFVVADRSASALGRESP